jgi:hypothetical protein
MSRDAAIGAPQEYAGKTRIAGPILQQKGKSISFGSPVKRKYTERSDKAAFRNICGNQSQAITFHPIIMNTGITLSGTILLTFLIQVFQPGLVQAASVRNFQSLSVVYSNNLLGELTPCG